MIRVIANVAIVDRVTSRLGAPLQMVGNLSNTYSGAKKVSPAEAPTRAATPFNVEAKVFVPSSSGEIRKTSSSFNPNAEAFVPMGSAPIKDPRESVLNELMEDRVVVEGNDGGNGEVSEVACGKVVIDRAQWEHTEELEIFKRMIVVVVRYYQGSHNLKSLRERFGVVKLMPFLRSIKELDLVGVHPEVRVRVKTEYMGELPVAAESRGDLKNILPFLASPGEYPPITNVELLTKLTGALPKGCGKRRWREAGIGSTTDAIVNADGKEYDSKQVQGGTPSAATAVVAQQLLRSQQELMQQLGAGSSAAIDSLMEELLSTSSPDLGHVEEVVKQLECVNGDLSENDEETFSRDMWLSLGTFRRLIVKAVEVVCREQDIKWRGMGGRVERSLVIGCSSAELAEKWEEMYPQLQPLESFYLPYFGVDDLERFKSAFPELWVVRLGERTCDVRVSTMGHVEKYCSVVPGRKGVEEKLKEQLRRLLTELVWRRCQEQRLEEVDRRARRGEGECGERLREERRKMEYAVERKVRRLEGTPSGVREGGRHRLTLRGVQKGVEGVLVEDVKKVWYEVYSRHLQALLDMCGVRKVLTLLRSCPCIVVEGEGLEARCLVRVRRPLVSVQPFARPSIVTPETVPLPTPMKGGVPQSQGGVDEEEEERLAMEKLLRQLIMHHDGEREEKEEKELTYSKEKMLSVRTAMLRYGVLEGPLSAFLYGLGRLVALIIG
ncbi:hypothetical protein Pmar_PMAR008243 [Perkinsus marinus ATCC 50983]|uniref:Uncharacterized protein n=1 Tax=Perkinsus marinus (strain ATCC 50983 / TXsc) TaxID=423536 RepID=C5LNP5_PERM5|nr:hypothetical protein Pmar_PMAR008243 [Perkinsus marinus ATCC 50983]EER01664.1 hypothetical protein Pmar_PMAR008243 [Perkinsus marinus ATCC 50983]|eukprot:XP_002768946.1 hypothetical protein Pmar_PMAR008243 [Perkinsus marinus ATCC 50983]